MRLEGELRIVVESKNKKGEMTPAALEKEMAANEITPSPQKDVKTAEKDLGSTQLRKTIFKKHYIDKMKEMGEEPAMVKGAMSNMKYDLDKNSA